MSRDLMMMLGGIVLMSGVVGALVGAIHEKGKPKSVTYKSDVEVIDFDDAYIRVMHDDKRGNTCYVLNHNIACVKDSEKELYR